MTMTDREVRKALEWKARAGLLPPQECPQCKASLADMSLPKEYAVYAPMFSLALEVQQTDGYWWLCPNCQHVWGLHARPA